MRTPTTPGGAGRPYDGQYRLYAARMKHPTTATATPVVESRLAKGDLIGFARDSAGGLLAVVRGEYRPLTDVTTGLPAMAFTFGRCSPTRGRSTDQDGVLVGTIVVVGVVIGVAAAAASSASSSTAIAWPL